jgi:hypothetical protein
VCKADVFHSPERLDPAVDGDYIAIGGSTGDVLSKQRGDGTGQRSETPVLFRRPCRRRERADGVDVSKAASGAGADAGSEAKARPSTGACADDEKR